MCQNSQNVSLAPVNPDLFYLSGTGQRAVKRVYVCVIAVHCIHIDHTLARSKKTAF